MIAEELIKHLGQKSWMIETESVDLFLTEQGGHMAPVFFKVIDRNGVKKKIQPYFISPWSIRESEVEEDLLRPFRGDFFCLPFGNQNKIDGENHPNHGETSNGNWTYQNDENINDFMIYNFGINTKVRKGEVFKRLGFKRGHSVVYSQHVVNGFSGHSSVGHHAILAMPETEKSVNISTSPIKFGITNDRAAEYSVDGTEYFSLKSSQVFFDTEKVPSIWADEPYLNCSTFPDRKGFGDLFAVFHEHCQPVSWTCAVYPSEGYLWFSMKDVSVLPGLIFWIENCSRKNFPWSQETNCLGLADMCGNMAKGLGDSIEPNKLNELGIRTSHLFGENKFEINYIQGVVAIPDGFNKVESIRFGNGCCEFISDSDIKVTSPVDYNFIRDGFCK